MASMYQQIMALAEETAREITSDTERYMAFLTTAAHNFKPPLAPRSAFGTVMASG